MYRFLPVLLLAWLVPAAAAGQWEVAVGVGYGERSNPLIQSAEVPIVVDLDVAWFGERGFFDNGDAGYTFVDNERFSLSIVGRINSDRLFFTRTDARFLSVTVRDGVVVACSPSEPGCASVQTRLAVPERDYALEGGVELLADGPWGYLQFAVYRDVSGVHDGTELLASYTKPWRRNRFAVEATISASARNARRNDYYWGVDADEAQLLLPRYHAGSGINVGLRLSASYQLNRHWAAVAVAQRERLASTIATSPMVRDDAVTGWFTGFRYRF